MKAIIDFGAIYWRNWHLSDGDAISTAARKTLSFVRSLYSEYGVDNIIVALDAPPYKRSVLYPEYKKNRTEKSQASIAELNKSIEAILNEGVQTARCQGYEADDVIATLVKGNDDTSVYGIDKDLLQCTDLVEPYTGEIKTAESRLGLKRESVPDYLALVGDKSDNIPGVRGVGDVTAKKLLESFGNIKGIYAALAEDETQFKRTAEALKEAAHWIDTSYQLVLLSDDLEIEFEKREIDKTKEVIADMAPKEEIEQINDAEQPQQTAMVQHADTPTRVVQCKDVEYKNSLEPVGMDELWRCANALYQSGLYGSFGAPQAIMAAIMHGREVGLGAATSVSSINVIQGKPSMGAEGLVAMVKASEKCEYLQCTERTDNSATWKTKRRGAPSEIVVSYTMEDARKAGKDKDRNYISQPSQMLMWRAASIICRMEYPDVTRGLMSTEETS